MSDLNSPTSETSEGKKKKFWMLLLILPIGLIVGTITSTYNHLKQDQEKDEMAQYRVSENISKPPLEDDLNKAFNTPNQDSRTTLKAISSSNGLNHYLKIRPVGDDSGVLGYYDVMAEKKGDRKNILAIAIELDEADAGSRAAMISTKIAVMKSVFGEKNFKHTLRFVFIPKRSSAVLTTPEILTINNEKLVDYFVIRPMDKPSFDSVNWVQIDHLLSHPALDRRAEVVLTDKQVNLTFQAAKQLRSFLLERL